MRVGILHLSDLHLSGQGDVLMGRASRIVPAIRSYVEDLEALFIVVSGDVAFSGLPTQYHQADRILSELTNNLTTSMPSVTCHTVMVPGNHDCDFSGDQSVRALILEAICNGNAPATSGMVETCCVNLKDYFAFSDKYVDPEAVIASDNLFTSAQFDVGNKRVTFHLLNTAWMSQRREVQGGIAYPILEYAEVLERATADLVVAVMHHPHNWLRSNDARELRAQLARNCDIAFVGHEHVSGALQQDDMQGHRIEYVEGGALQEPEDNSSEFNLLVLNQQQNEQRLVRFEWKEERYSLKVESVWRSLRLSEGRKTRPFELRQTFTDHLEEPGMTINHPRKAEVLLSDLFMYPDARCMTGSEKNELKYVNLSAIVKNHKGNTKCIIAGDEKSGKTALCKMLYREFYNMELVPVLVDGASFTTPILKECEKVLNEAFADQYREGSAEIFTQLDDTSKVIIIDDIDRSRLNTEGTQKLVEGLSRKYSNLIVTGNSLVRFLGLFATDPDGDVNKKFEKYELEEFGHQLRFDLIDKWNGTGREYTFAESERVSANDRVQGIVDTVIGASYVPSYPFYLLVILQTIETGSQDTLRNSVYGHYYDFLIKQAIVNSGLTNDELEAFYNFISELAFKMFSKKQMDISVADFDAFSTSVREKFDLLQSTLETVRKTAVETVLTTRGDRRRFRQAYIYYYFAARYMTKHIAEAEIRETIRYMCEKVHVDEFGNIIMFLVHMSNDSFIVDEIVARARVIFAEVEAARLETDATEFNRLVQIIPHLVFEHDDKSATSRRRELLAAQDSRERESGEERAGREAQPWESSKDESAAGITADESDIMATIYDALKMLDILGQILKNYYGSIVGERKLELCEEAFGVGLRALASFMGLLADNVDTVVSAAEEVFAELDPSRSRERREEVARGFVFRLATLLSFVFVKRIAVAVGSKNLGETFRRVMEREPSIAVRLIDVAIKLDYLQTIPFDELEALRRITSGNALGLTVARMLVVSYLYLFEVDFGDQQRVTTLLGISTWDERKIRLASKNKKKVLGVRRSQAAVQRRRVVGRKMNKRKRRKEG